MPYENEYAQYKPLRRLVESERVRDLLGSYKVQSSTETAVSEPLMIVSKDDLGSTAWQPDWVLAIDGSHHEVPVKNGYPGAKASYQTVASVLIDAAKIRELDQQRPIDPRKFRTVEQAGSIDCALPGCNIIYEGEISAKSSLRRARFEIMDITKLELENESLLDTYEALLQYKPDTREQHCPYD